jgi:FlaG/FlaF family flagellin (archaellin)
MNKVNDMRKIEKMFRMKRAFSAVIAALILMLLAVAAGVVVYAYVMGWIGGATQNPQRQGQIQFDSIYADTSGSKIKIYVRNVGGVNLNVSKIYVNGVEKTNATVIPAVGKEVSVQSVTYLEVTQTMTKNYFYEVAVTCKDGTSASQSVQAK